MIAVAGSHDTVVSLFHMTVLSNLARAYDKYRRVYSKASIPESTYPTRFHVLEASDLAVGRAKAAGLLAKLGLPSNELIALESRLPRGALERHPRGGPGLVWPSPELPVHRIHRFAGSDIVPWTPEDAMAKSLRLGAASFVPYRAMRPRSVSLLPIARGCQAACPFCFSEASASAEQRQARIDPTRVDEWLRLARERGAERAVITGGGEPTLLGDDAMARLVRVSASRFNTVVLITNGYALATAEDPAASILKLHNAGLSVLAVSRHHMDEAANARLMNLETRTPLILAARRRLGSALRNFRLRVVCVLQRGGVETATDVGEFVEWAAAEGADEVCFKELYVSTSFESVYHSARANAWSAANQVSLSVVVRWAAERDARVAGTLPWGAIIFEAHVAGRSIRVAAYTEPSLFWERTSGIARSWNVMADGSCLVSLEDRASTIEASEAGDVT